MVNKGSLLSQPLIEAIRPADSDGPLISVVCSTHGLDLDQPNFFEHDFVPTLLGLGGVRDRGYAIPVATERKLAESYCALVYDAHALALGGRPSLRVDVLPVSRQLNHAKIVLIHRQRLVRLIIGSANLTHAGYRTQREIAAVLDFKPGGNIAPSVLEEAVRGWIEALGEMTSPPLRDNLNEAVHAAQQLVEKQQRANTGDMTVVFGGGSEPLWQKIAAAWQHGEPLLKWYICSPFWPGPGDSETPFEKMISALSGKGCNCADAELVLVARADAPNSQARPIFPYALVRRLRERRFPIEHGMILPARLEALPEEILEGTPGGNRDLHAKWMILEGASTAVVFLGSANFTRKGLGVLSDPRRANIEAGVLLRLPHAAIRPEGWIPPIATAGRVDWTSCCASDLSVGQEEEGAIEWPSFILWIEVEVRWEQFPDPSGSLSVITVAGNKSEFDVIVATDSQQGELLKPTDTFAFDLSPAAVVAVLAKRTVLIRWGSPPSEVLFPVNISESSKAALPSVLDARPTESQLLAYFHGKISEDDLLVLLEERGRKPELAMHVVADLPTLYDLQNYIVRDFVESLFGLKETLERSITGPRALEQALLGDMSPLRLAEEILQAYRRGERSPTAVAFQFVELIRVVSELAVPLTNGLPVIDHATSEALKEITLQRLFALVRVAAGQHEFRTVCAAPDFSRFVNASLGNHIVNRWSENIQGPHL